MDKLLAPDEPSAFSLAREDSRSPFVLICDHAGKRIPRALGDLGVSAAERERHIAWDIGAAAVASQLSQRLDAFFIQQTYSRLVIDCNRPLGSAGSIVTRSELTDIPGNIDIDDASRLQRAREIFLPYHDRIVRELDRRSDAKLPAILVSVHSFTPVYLGTSRPWHIGMLYGRNARIANILLGRIRAQGEWNVGDNEPYAVTPITDYAIPVHGEKRGIPNVGLEIRQDLIADEAGQSAWAERIARWLSPLPRELGLSNA